MKWQIPSASGFKPHWILKIFFLAAFVLTVAMSFTSNFNRHPDEIHHFEAAKYYTNHWLPPVIEDPLIRDSYSTYGVSYLNYHWAEYVYAGTAMRILSPFVSDPHLAARLSSVLLFAFLIAFFFYRSRQENETLIIPAFLLISSQVWYVFNYINNDAFVLFTSLLTAYQLIYERSLFNQFMQSETFSGKFAGGLFFGFLTGLLLICKPNYYSFLVFVALWLVYKFFIRKIFFEKAKFDLTIVKKLALVAFVAFSILTFRCALDFCVNGETNFVGISYISKYFGKLEKRGRLLEYQEQIADYNCKPSTLENDLANSHPDLALKTKGVGLKELLFKRLWLEYSLNSFVGGYGYMEFFAPRRVWQFMGLLYFLLGLYVVSAVVVSGGKEGLIESVIFVSGVFLTVSISVALSWIYAFQPQGRYLFPILGMLGVFVYSNRKHFHNLIMHGFIITAFLLVAYSFAFVALPGINNK